MVEIDWRPDERALRKFGVVVIVGMAVVGAAFRFAFHEPGAAQLCWIASGVLGLPALTGTAVGLPGYWLWMGIAFVMGNIMSRVLLTLIYVVVFTPLGLLRRSLGGDALALRKRKADSYWVDVKGGSGSTGYERQF